MAVWEVGRQAGLSFFGLNKWIKFPKHKAELLVLVEVTEAIAGRTANLFLKSSIIDLQSLIPAPEGQG